MKEQFAQKLNEALGDFMNEKCGYIVLRDCVEIKNIKIAFKKDKRHQDRIVHSFLRLPKDQRMKPEFAQDRALLKPFLDIQVSEKNSMQQPDL